MFSIFLDQMKLIIETVSKWSKAIASDKVSDVISGSNFFKTWRPVDLI